MTGETVATRPRVRDIQGWSYQSGQALAMRRPEWAANFEAVIAAGGNCHRVAGDMTAFDAKGRMLFEAYEY